MAGALRSGFALLLGVHALLAPLPGRAATLDLTVDPGIFAGTPPPPNADRLSSGIDLALRDPLLNVSLGYDVQIAVDEKLNATNDNIAQRVNTALHSNLFNRLLGVQGRVHTDSVFHTAADAYNHRISPGFSRRLAHFATLDVNYQVLLRKPSADAVTQQHHSYTFGLRGSLPGNSLHWSGAYTSADLYIEGTRHTQSSESVQLQSSYRLLPHMQLQLSSEISHNTHFQAARDITSVHTRHGAGVQWTPAAAPYSLKASINRTAISPTGEESLMRRGTLSWFPRHDLTLSLNYSDQLVEGRPGVLLNTRLLIGGS